MISQEDMQSLQLLVDARRFRILGGSHEAVGTDEFGPRLIGYRPYEWGDGIRTIDAHQSARAGELMVAKIAPERSLQAVVVLDLSARHCHEFGGVVPKGEAMKTIAAALTYLLTRLGDQVGAVLVGKGEPVVVEFGRSNTHFEDIEAAIEQLEPGNTGEELLPIALEAVADYFPQKNLVLVISDFFGGDWQPALLSAGDGFHQTMAVQVLDPWDQALPDLGTKRVSGQRWLTKFNQGKSKARFGTAVEEQEMAIDGTLTGLDVRRLQIVIDQGPISGLIDALKEAA